MFEELTIPKELYPTDPRFGVGPSLIPTPALDALAATGSSLLGTSHRKPAVVTVIKEIHKGLREYFKIPEDYKIIIGNGGATFFFDMLALGLTKKSSYHFVTGEFSNKWYLAHNKVPWINAVKEEVEYGQGIDPYVKEGFDVICTTLNETSTGVLINSVPTTDDSTLLAVDATSGGGQVALDMNKVDVYFFSPQKVFASEGGTYVSFMSPKAVARANEIESQSDRYIPEIMSFKNALSNGDKYQTYNTPSVTSLFLLNEQIKLMNDLGEKEVIRQANEKLSLITDWIDKNDYLTFYVQKKSFRSNCVATINVNNKYSVSDLASRLRDLNVAYDIESYRKLGENQLRISLFHNVKIEDLEKLTKIVSLAIETERS
jgi:phosphoserine aminotransferase